MNEPDQQNDKAGTANKPSGRPSIRKALISALLVAIALMGAMRSLDQAALVQLDESFKRALATYAIVRGINAIISVVQGTEVAIEPGGVGVVLTPGEIFDPINDLAERFSWVMLLASASLGAQRLLVSLGESPLLQGLMLLSVGYALWQLWSPKPLNGRWRARLTRLAVFFLVLRFAVPVTAVMGDLVYTHFLSERYEAAYTSLENTHEDVRALREAEKPPPAKDDKGLLGKLGRWYSETSARFAIEERSAEYRQKLGNAVQIIIELIVIFVLQTIMLPLLFLALGLRLLRLINPIPQLLKT